MGLTFWRLGKTDSQVPAAANQPWLTEPTLTHLEECIAAVRNAPPKERAIALDGLAFVAGDVMDSASHDWEKLVGRKWERYVD